MCSTAEAKGPGKAQSVAGDEGSKYIMKQRALQPSPQGCCGQRELPKTTYQKV